MVSIPKFALLILASISFHTDATLPTLFWLCFSRSANGYCTHWAEKLSGGVARSVEHKSSPFSQHFS